MRKATFGWKRTGRGPPVLLSLRQAFESFPVRTDVVMLDTTGEQHPRSEGPLWTLIRYDFSAPKSGAVRIHGIIRLADVEKSASLLESAIGLGKESVSSLRDLSLCAIQDGPRMTHIVPFDIRDRVEDYAVFLFRELYQNSSFLVELFLAKTDFNSKYRLEPDPVTDEVTLLSIDGRTAMFSGLSGTPATLAEREGSTADIQLIAQVPGELRKFCGLLSDFTCTATSNTRSLQWQTIMRTLRWNPHSTTAGMQLCSNRRR